jgi:hypothetical protein
MDDLMSTDACTLPSIERTLRLAEFDRLFTEAVHDVELAGERVRMHLVGDSRLGERVRDLADRESACCSFFTFRVGCTDSDVTLEITVPPDHCDILTALAERAAELSA